jgi:hypothetical protein
VAPRKAAGVTCFSPRFVAVILATVTCLWASGARAADTIRTPGDHPSYALEIEPHLLFGWDSLFPGDSVGFGARISIPILENGFVRSINDSVAITFGADVLHYDGCYIPKYTCSANFLVLPAALQWNFYLARHWSVFGEPGLFVYHGFFDSCPTGTPCVNVPSATGVQPAVFVGGRYELGDHVSLTVRLGYPTISFGISFL